MTAQIKSRFPFAKAAAALAVGTMLAVFTVGGADTTYVIRKSDTLTSIARRYGVSVSELARYNGISKTATIYADQRLRIPPKGAARLMAALPAEVRGAIETAKVEPGRWKYIVIHHSATEMGTAKGMDAYHREHRHMENGLAYHFVIGNGQGMKDGAIAVGNRWTAQLDGGHLTSLAQNKVSLGICLVGNFEKQKPTKKQLESLKALLLALLDRCHLSLGAVKTHQQINVVYTRCPGRRFPWKSLVKDLKALR